jgi:CRP-like cAMP-binding protein
MDVRHPSAEDLSRVPLLSGLTEEEREELAARFEIEEVDTGRRLVAEGRAGYSFYVIDRGRASVAHDGTPVREIGPGDSFGEIAILGHGRRTATVTAVEPVVAWKLFGTHFRTLQAERPDVATALETAMHDKLAEDSQSAGG